MIKYKANPLFSLSNKSFFKEFIQNSSNENDDQYIKQLLSSIDFDFLEKSNEDIDLISLEKMLYNLLILLNYGISLTDFPENLIPKILDLSFFYQSDQNLISLSINFIYFMCKLDDDICFHCIDEKIINFIYETIDFSLVLNDIKVALLCLLNLTSPKMQQTCTKLDGILIYQKATDFLQKFKQNFDFNDQSVYEDVIYSLFELIANCLISYDLSCDEIENIIKQMFEFLYPNWESKNEPEAKINRIIQISVSQAISKVIFYKSNNQIDHFIIDQFMKDEILDLFINLIKSDFDFELEKLSINIFCILENLSFINPFFSLHFISHPSSPIYFQPPEHWGSKAKSKFCKSIVSSVGKLRECCELKKGDEFLELSMEQLREAASDVIVLMMNYINQEYKLRKSATMVLCQLISLNDSQILSILLIGHKNIIDDFIFFLDGNVKEYLAYSLIKSLRVLCLYGDKISQESQIPNPFLEIIDESDIDLEEVLDNCAQKYFDSKKMMLLIDNFKDVIQNCFEWQDIDQESEETFEIFI